MALGNAAISWCPAARLHHCRNWLLGVTSAIALMLVGLSSGQAAAYPAFQDAYVNDYGNVLTPAEASQVKGQLEQFRAQTGIHAVLLTINSVQDYATGDAAIEPFATAVFNTWGIGDAARHDGILLLVAPGDRKVRIELGRGYSTSHDWVAQAIIDDVMLPQFRQGNMARGTIAGINQIVQDFDPGSSLSTSPTRRYLKALIPRVSAGQMVGVALGVGGVGGVSGLVVFRQWRRYHKRQCPKCQADMERLDEQADDHYLTAGGRVEESLHSVDYDVWLCRSCGHHTVSDYGNVMSGYKKCPGCHHKTMAVNTRTLVAPTYSSTGKAEVTEDCKFCDRHHTYTRTLPRKERPSSSSSGGHGGGGRSSGGGASGSW